MLNSNADTVIFNILKELLHAILLLMTQNQIKISVMRSCDTKKNLSSLKIKGNRRHMHTPYHRKLSYNRQIYLASAFL